MIEVLLDFLMFVAAGVGVALVVIAILDRS